MSERIEKLKDAVQVMHRCTATHRESVHVREMFRDQVAWEGIVEVFDIVGHPKADRCYAWSYHDDSDSPEYATVLKIPPATSAALAVKVYIASLGRK